MVFQLTALSHEDRDDLESIAADYSVLLEPDFEVAIDEMSVTSRDYPLPGRDIEWLWAIHDSEA